MTDRTTDELRDRLAEIHGFKKHEIGYWHNGTEYLPDGHPKNGRLMWDHPFPAGDLTALAAAWPEGWRIAMMQLSDGTYWVAGTDRVDGEVTEQEAPTEYEARLRLTVAVLEAKAAEVKA